MQSFINFFNIFGLSPFSKKPLVNLALILYSLICLLGSCITIGTAIIRDDVVLDSSVNHLASGIYFLSLNAAQLIISLETIVFRKEQQYLFELFSNVDEIFRERLNWTISYSKERRQKWKILLSILIVFSSIRTYFVVQLFNQNLINAYWYQCLLAVFVNRLSTVRNLFYVITLINRLKFVNENLEKNLTTTAFDQAHVLPSGGSGDPCPSLPFNIEPCEEGPDFHKILALKNIYGKLYSIGDVINSTIGWSFLAIFTHAFINFTLAGYWVFVAIQEKRSDQRGGAITSIFMLFPDVFQLFIIAFYCNSATKIVSKCYISYTQRLFDEVCGPFDHTFQR